MKDLSIVKYNKNDYENFREYITGAFHQKYILGDEKFLKWQYSGSGTLYLVKYKDKIIGNFGCKDLPYKVYDKTSTVRAVMNLFVLEKYRKIGVAPLLVKEVFDTQDYILNLGYNNIAESLQAKFRKNWHVGGSLSRYLIILNPEHDLLKKYTIINKREVRLPAGDRTSKFSGRFDHTFDKFWEKVRTRYPITAERSSQYLQWRFSDHPHLKYSYLIAKINNEIAGYLVYRIEETSDFKIARIVDFISHYSSEKSLLFKFLELAELNGAHAADFIFSGDFYKSCLKETGFFDTAGTDFEKFPIRFNPISYSKFEVGIAYDIEAPLSDFYLTRADADQDRPNPH